MKKLLLTVSLLTMARAAFSIDIETYRKISRPGMDGGQVMMIAGSPDVQQRDGYSASCKGIVERWFYRGSDNALEGKQVVVELCGNKVTGTSTIR